MNDRWRTPAAPFSTAADMGSGAGEYQRQA